MLARLIVVASLAAVGCHAASRGEGEPSTSGGGAGGAGGEAAGQGGTAPVFVAQGFGALMVVSCDDGRTWKKTNQIDSNNDDHSELSSQGLAFGDGAFVAVFGWGEPNSIFRSEDAATWTRVFRSDAFLGLGDVAYGRGVFLAGAQMVSRDAGQTWTKLAAGMNARRTFFLERGAGAGRFVAIDNGPHRFSDDAGLSWTAVSGPSECAGNWQFGGGVVKAGATTVVVNGDGYACVSRDDMTTMQLVTKLQVPTVGSVVADGEQVVAAVPDGAASGRLFRTSDGRTWTNVSLEPSGTRVQWLRRSTTTGTWVGVSGGGQFFRSEDGTTWSATTSFSGARFTELVYGGSASPSLCR